MKKLLILVIVVGVIAGLYYWGSTRVSVLESEGKLAPAKPGRVEVPITASGEATERQRVEIKAEASGTIVDIPVDEGDIVQPDQLLVQIDEEEEQRNVDRAQAAVDQAREAVEISKIAHEQALNDEQVNIELAEAALEVAQARHDFQQFEFERIKGLYGAENSSEVEVWQTKTSYLTAKAELTKAKAELERVKTTGPRNVKRTAREIASAEARLRSAEFALRDADRRFRKTKIVNNYPSACRVVRVYFSEGQVVSSATSVVGAGTPVMELADISVMEVEAAVDESDVDKVVQMMVDGQEQRDRRKTMLAGGKAQPAKDAPEDRGPAADGGETDNPADHPAVTGHEPTTRPTQNEERKYRDEVHVTFDALPRETFTGRIVEVAQKPRTIAQIVTYPVRVRLYEDPRIESVRLGMQGTVEFAPVVEEGISVPYEAVERRDRDTFIVRMPDPEDSRADPVEREVEVGLTDGRKVVIRDGLEKGEEVYTELPRRIRTDEPE